MSILGSLLSLAALAPAPVLGSHENNESGQA